MQGCYYFLLPPFTSFDTKETKVFARRLLPERIPFYCSFSVTSVDGNCNQLRLLCMRLLSRSRADIAQGGQHGYESGGRPHYLDRGGIGL